MSGNFQKTPFTDTLNSFAARKAQDALSLTGKALPASVAAIPTPGVPIVTVKFEIQDPTFTTLPNVTMPVIGSEYIRIPLQAPSGTIPGTQGVVIAVDAYIGGVSGLGGGVADLTQRANLSTLFFVPIGNKNWVPTGPQFTTIYGAPNGGTMIQDTVQNKSSVSITGTQITELSPEILLNASNGNSTITMTSASIVLTSNGHTLTINSTGIILDGIAFMTHVHSGVQGGTGDTGPVV